MKYHKGNGIGWLLTDLRQSIQNLRVISHPCLKLRVGNNSKNFEMAQVSNQDITEVRELNCAMLLCCLMGMFYAVGATL